MPGCPPLPRRTGLERLMIALLTYRVIGSLGLANSFTGAVTEIVEPLGAQSVADLVEERGHSDLYRSE